MDSGLRACCPGCNSLGIHPRPDCADWRCKTCGGDWPQPRYREVLRHRGQARGRDARIAYGHAWRARKKALREGKPPEEPKGSNVAGPRLIRGFVF